MTTKITIENAHESNGDVHVYGFNTCEGTVKITLLPGDPKREIWITDNSMLAIRETWPTILKGPTILNKKPTEPAS